MFIKSLIFIVLLFSFSFSFAEDGKNNITKEERAEIKAECRKQLKKQKNKISLTELNECFRAGVSAAKGESYTKAEDKDEKKCDDFRDQLLKEKKEMSEACEKAGGGSGGTQCFESAMKCTKCMASHQSRSSNRKYTALTLKSDRVKNSCGDDKVSNHKESSAPTAADIIPALGGKTSQPRQYKNSTKLFSKRKLYNSCPLMAKEGLHELKKESKDLRDELRDLEKDLSELNKNLTEAQHEESKAQNEHEAQMTEINDKFKQGIKDLEKAADETTKKHLAQIQALQDSLEQNSAQVDAADLAWENQESVFRDKITAAETNCRNQARSQVGEERKKRRDKITKGTHSTSVMGAYKKAGLTDFVADRGRVDDLAAKCLVSTEHKTALKLIQRERDREYKKYELALKNIGRARTNFLRLISEEQAKIDPADQEIRKEIAEVRAKWAKDLYVERVRYFGPPPPRGGIGEKQRLAKNTEQAKLALDNAEKDIKERKAEYKQLMMLQDLADSVAGGHSTDKGSPGTFLSKAVDLEELANNTKDICCTGDSKHGVCGLIRDLYKQGSYSKEKAEQRRSSGKSLNK